MADSGIAFPCRQALSILLGVLHLNRLAEKHQQDDPGTWKGIPNVDTTTEGWLIACILVTFPIEPGPGGRAEEIKGWR